jgi:zinc D-Ala-D-Ala carboxypeptidase
MQLSQHFTLDEFIKSETAIAIGDANLPTPEDLENLRLNAQGMEEVRALLGGRAIIVTSGYRNRRVNAAVRGVPTSAHALGFATDFHHATLTDLEAARRIADSDLKFDQLIYEKGRCVHISFDPRMRRQVLSQPGGPGSAVLQGIQP